MAIPFGIKKTAVLCILKSGDQFLLLKRLKAPNAGLYTPVGGKVDPYESPTAAAYREAFEETGIIADNFHYCGVLVETSPVDYNWTSFVYLAEIPFCKAPQCNEGTLEWIAAKDLKSLATPATDWFIYQYVADRKTFFFNALYNEELNLLSMTEEITGEQLFSGLE